MSKKKCKQKDETFELKSDKKSFSCAKCGRLAHKKDELCKPEKKHA